MHRAIRSSTEAQIEVVIPEDAGALGDLLRREGKLTCCRKVHIPRVSDVFSVENFLSQLFIVSGVTLSRHDSPLAGTEDVIGEASWSPSGSGQ